MKLLEQRIVKDGRVYAGDVLKVDSFVNHQMDVDFLCLLEKEFYRLFADCGVSKILTIEASGIGIACLAAQFFHCPVVFAKKSRSSNLSRDVWASRVHSYTHNTDHDVIVSKRYLQKGEKVLIIDDFLANGNAARALIDLCGQAGAEVVGLGMVIEKVYQDGGKQLREEGFRVEALARIASMSPEDGIKFC